MCKSNWSITEGILLLTSFEEMRNCRLCQGATKLLGLRLKGGNIRRHAATMARTVEITKQATLKGLGIRRCISSLQNTEHFSIFHLEMESRSLMCEEGL